MTGSIKRNPILVGIAGGSGSGKTYFARALQQRLGLDLCDIVYQDSFYLDQSQKFDFDGGSVNFDHPDALDFPLMAKCLSELKSGRSTQIPVYDFKTHARSREPVVMHPKPIILVDGILIFHPPMVRQLFDELVFVDTHEELRFQRRLRRDVHERGRTPDGVRNQFFKQVKPMHDQFVEPSKQFAQTKISDVGDFETMLHNFELKLRSML